ncbi:MAG: RNA 2',3'-cyclic phosphodiesterase [Acidimicrobiia bacterium]
MAVRPPGEVLDALEAALRPARAASATGVRWAGREQWHLTLAFLGAVADVGAVAAALKAAGAGRAPFRFRLGGGGAFPTPKKARVLWVGSSDGATDMAGLAGAVAAALVPLGYAGEERRFRGHVTVGRLRAPADVRPVVAALGEGRMGRAWTVEEVVLYESRLSPAGSTYTVLERVALSAP